MPRDGTDPLAFDAGDTAIDGDGDGSELIGQTIDGRYRLEAMLGRGGMGLVFRAAHVGLRRQVAVKILHPSLATSSDVRNRFEREALAVGKIDHPHCVTVYDVGRLHDGSLYLAMELLEGRALADVLEQEGQLAPGRALHILAGVLRGLSHIHAAGMIHRDIKPENIFLIRQGADEDFAKILDFGIAKPMSGKTDLDDGVKLTQAGMAFGTPIYMAPEQALGNPMDGRADLYAAAVLGYEMLCGQPPFYSEDKLEVMSMHTARPVPPMRQRLIRGGKPVPSSIERLIVRGLTKKPSERYPNADVFLAAVEGALKTPDGGVTDVSFERPETEHPGAHALTFEDGRVRITGPAEFVGEEGSAQIADAIDEALATARPAGNKPAGKAAPFPLDTPTSNAVTAPGPVAAVAAASAANPKLAGRSIGLPYTGPSGEPIFGLTPEQRLAQAGVGFESGENPSLARALEPEQDPRRAATGVAAKKKRWALYGGILGVAIIAGIAIAVLTIPKQSGDEDEEEGKPDPKTPAGQAYAALDRKDLDAAMKILTDNKDAIESDPYGQLVLGHVYAYRNDTRVAVVAYQKAMQLDPALRTRKRMRTALRTMAALEKDPVLAIAAMQVWVQSGDEEARRALIKAAESEDMPRRKAARPVLTRLNLHREVNWIASYNYDLQQEPECEDRKPVVARLRALEDPRAIPALQQAIARKGTQGKYANKPINGCLVDDAKAAIGYLEGLKKGEPAKAP
ncbi:MAG TPA: protein kinase [Kofleriaceae bacterium]|nr:protein kinase [Kofleriaceae bacterium]